MKYFALFSVFVASQTFAQVTIDKPKPEPKSSVGSTEIYIGAGRNNAFRTLETNDAPFGKPLGYRADEQSIKIWAYEAGFRRTVNQHLIVDGGLGIERFGESYASEKQAETGDSTYSYTNHYSYVTMPIQCYGYIGEDFKLFLGAGLQPGLVGKFVKNTTITDSIGNSITTEVNKPEQLSSFLLNARMSSGITWSWSKSMSVYLLYTYQIGLTSTYEPQQAYKHYMRAGSVRFGVAFTIPE